VADQWHLGISLDEAQKIKNPSAASSVAIRSLTSPRRVALTGTPIENHLSELWSIMDVLNPGLLGSAREFRERFAVPIEKLLDRDRSEHLRKMIRPFVLRRTKTDPTIASDLPEKIEMDQICDLAGEQKNLYTQVVREVRAQIMGDVERLGVSGAHIQILAGLTRLRQAACHPALIDPDRSDAGSAKLDLLVPRLVETIDEGHKALVFSQFTSFLGLLRTELQERNIAFEYLDGRTKDRAAHVERFQTDESCRLFLISLKAGGVGLNLTAADYVFILDPWWNPAAEAQAVDRAHRIGQMRNVFAYRLIARDTVEERVLELQQRKRALADAIITADNSVVRSLKREDLELLLS